MSRKISPLPAFFVEDLVTQTGIQLQCAVLHTGAEELLIRPAETGAVGAHGVLVAGDEQHRRVRVHSPQVAEPLVEADAAEHLTEQPHRGVRAAQGIGDVGVHVARSSADSQSQLVRLGAKSLLYAPKASSVTSVAGGRSRPSRRAAALATASPPAMTALGCQPVPMMMAAFTVPG